MTVRQLIDRLQADHGYQFEGADLDGLAVAPSDPVPDDCRIRLIRMVGTFDEWRPLETVTVDDIEVHIDTKVRAH